MIADSKDCSGAALTRIYKKAAVAIKDKRAWSAESFFHKLVSHGEKDEPDKPAHPEKSALDLGDIQGFIVRGYRMPMVRHFVLAVGGPAKARELLGRLVSGERVRLRHRSPLRKTGT